MSVTKASRSNLNLGEGKDLVKLSAMLLMVDPYFIFTRPSQSHFQQTKWRACYHPESQISHQCHDPISLKTGCKHKTWRIDTAI